MTRVLWIAATIAVGVGLAATTAAAAAGAQRHALHAGQALRPGQALVSPNRKFEARIQHGRLVVSNRAGHWLWATPKAGRSVTLRVGGSGQLKLTSQHRNRWVAGTAGSGRRDVLRMGDNGVLDLSGPGGLVWSSQLRNGCASAGRGRLFVVDLSHQLARACRHGQQLRVTRVTTGAVDLGEGTPRGTWHVQAKIRDTTLYPAAGGAYHVKYWVPYDGAYGLHDSPWQRFPYGSPKYRRQGSHGCVHVPGPMMAWLFSWLRIGSTVTIHR